MIIGISAATNKFKYLLSEKFKVNVYNKKIENMILNFTSNIDEQFRSSRQRISPICCDICWPRSLFSTSTGFNVPAKGNVHFVPPCSALV
jgi:hypothetical protein